MANCDYCAEPETQESDFSECEYCQRTLCEECIEPSDHECEKIREEEEEEEEATENQNVETPL